MIWEGRSLEEEEELGNDKDSHWRATRRGHSKDGAIKCGPRIWMDQKLPNDAEELPEAHMRVEDGMPPR